MKREEQLCSSTCLSFQVSVAKAERAAEGIFSHKDISSSSMAGDQLYSWSQLDKSRFRVDSVRLLKNTWAQWLASVQQQKFITLSLREGSKTQVALENLPKPNDL